MADIVLPYDYAPRDYQKPFWNFMEGGGKRYVGVWHRRAGKDRTVFAHVQKAMFTRKGLYWHVLPDAEQGRKIIWNGMTFEGNRFIDLFPKEIVSRKRDDMMLLETSNGSIYQVVGAVGSDGTAKHLRGPNPVGVVFSEMAFYAHPECWEVIRPILNENGGWAIFISTPMGRNWFHDIYERAKLIPGWKCELLTIEDTKRPDGSPVITQEAIEEDRANGASESKIQQEYYCSFDSPFEGAIWGDDMRRIALEGNITDVPYNPRLPVETWLDLGFNDPGAAWFLQYVNNERHFIDYHQQSNWSTLEWARFILNKPYTYSRHIAPWDAGHHNPDTGKVRSEFAAEVGLRYTIARKPANIGDQIEAARAYLRRYKCKFDLVKTRVGVAALSQYRWKRDRSGNPTGEILKTELEHGAAAFRTGVTMDLDPIEAARPRQHTAYSDYDLLQGVEQRSILNYARQQTAMSEESDERAIWWT